MHIIHSVAGHLKLKKLLFSYLSNAYKYWFDHCQLYHLHLESYPERYVSIHFFVLFKVHVQAQGVSYDHNYVNVVPSVTGHLKKLLFSYLSYTKWRTQPPINTNLITVSGIIYTLNLIKKGMFQFISLFYSKYMHKCKV